MGWIKGLVNRIQPQGIRRDDEDREQFAARMREMEQRLAELSAVADVLQGVDEREQWPDHTASHGHGSPL